MKSLTVKLIKENNRVDKKGNPLTNLYSITFDKSILAILNSDSKCYQFSDCIKWEVGPKNYWIEDDTLVFENTCCRLVDENSYQHIWIKFTDGSQMSFYVKGTKIYYPWELD